MERIYRDQMERKRRAINRSAKCENGQGYVKRKMTIDTVCHYILHPVVYSTIGKSNDFFFHALRLCWNDKNILKDTRCKKLLYGLHLREGDIETLDVMNLTRSNENGWFTSSRENDLAKIGKLSGYFLRRFACTIGKALDDNFDPECCSWVGDKNLDELLKELKERTIIPVIVKLEISPHSEFDSSRFVCLAEDVVNNLVNGKEMVISRRVKLLEISAAFHDKVWLLLNSSAPGTRQQLINELFNNTLMEIVPLEAENENRTDMVPPVEDKNPNLIIPMGDISPKVNSKDHQARVCSQLERRPASSRSKQRNARYPIDEFDME